MNKIEELEKKFERDVIFYYKNMISFVDVVNSPSSANLVSLATITDLVFGSRRARVGDEIITTVSGHPSITNSIVQNGLVPVYLDVDLGTFHPDFEILEQSITDKVRGIVLGHPLGNPYDMEILRDICDEYGIWMIEDCLDAVGSTLHNIPVGACGDISTLALDMGVCVSRSPMVHKVLDTFSNGDTSKMGYDLKVVATSPFEIKDTGELWEIIYDDLKKYKKYFHFMKTIPDAAPSWSHFALIVKETAPFTKAQLLEYLLSKGVNVLCSFYGNVLNFPAYKDIEYRVVGTLFNSDVIDRNSIFINLKGLNNKKVQSILEILNIFLKGKTNV